MTVRPLSTRRTTLGLSGASGVAAPARSTTATDPIDSVGSTVPTTDPACDSGTPARRRWLGLRARLVAVLAVLATTLGLGVAAAPAASANTTATVTVCFQNNYHYSVFGTPWTREVKYILWNPSTRRWQVQARYASPNGCTRFNVYAGYASYFEAYENWGSYYYSGQTGVNTFRGGYSYHLGWHNVNKTLTF